MQITVKNKRKKRTIHVEKLTEAQSLCLFLHSQDLTDIEIKADVNESQLNLITLPGEQLELI